MHALLLLEDRSLAEPDEPWRRAPSPDPSPFPDPGRPRVLIAEDDPVVRSLIVRLLEEDGYTVVSARHGAEALETALATESIDLLITDVRMPVMDGWELGRQLRRRWPALPVLYISGFDDELTRGSGAASARGAFLRKPFDLAELSRQVARLLDAE
ncbi:MAG TPA: response regulator [Gemmatimonadales bacterium]|nr:response regulator [Gemmatimonadales bacterium]